MKEVITGIYQLQLPLPFPTELRGYVNTYLIQGDNEYLLIDTGWNTEEAFDSLKKQLADIGIGFGDITQIVVTHRHPDHYGLAAKLKRFSQAKLAFHYLEKDFIKLRYKNVNEFIHQMEQWLYINEVPADEMSTLRATALGSKRLITPASPDVTFRGGETLSTGLFSFKVLWTPGHSVGHICLCEPAKKVLISGDHILPNITPNISLYPQSSSNPLGDYLNSLNALKQLEVNLILPGHENPFTGLQPRIEELIQHHKQRKSEILETLKAKPKTTYQISTEITWIPEMGGVSWQNLAPLDKRLAVLETLAHLESMRVDGKVDKFFRDGTIYYQPS